MARAGQIVILTMGVVYLVMGRPNADEGWYLYAGRLVTSGDLPYRDFAFTQTPLVPYVYGLVQLILGSGVLVGRVTSLALMVGTLTMGSLAARRMAGYEGEALAMWLLAAYTPGVYFLVIVKTYALVTFWFMATIWVFSSNWPSGWKYSVGVLCGFLATMTRLSALPSFVILTGSAVWWTIRRQDRRVWRSVAAVWLASVSVFAWFFVQAPEAAWWNLLGYHLGQWGQTSWASRLLIIVRDRLPDLARHHVRFLPVLLVVVGAFAAKRSIRRAVIPTVSQQRDVVIGILLFAAAHLVTGGWHVEYFVPAVVPLLLIVGVVAGRMAQRRSGWTVLLPALVVAITLTTLVRHSCDYIFDTGSAFPLERIHRLATWLGRQTKPTDRLFVLEALWVAVDSNRRTLPGMSLAQFSYQDLPTAKARRFNVVNGAMMIQYLREGRARAVVLTDLDWKMFAQAGLQASVERTLVTKYTAVLSEDRFGQRGGQVFVFIRNGGRPSCSRSADHRTMRCLPAVGPSPEGAPQDGGRALPSSRLIPFPVYGEFALWYPYRGLPMFALHFRSWSLALDRFHFQDTCWEELLIPSNVARGSSCSPLVATRMRDGSREEQHIRTCSGSGLRPGGRRGG